ncbi:hypothetical protein HHL17_15865 [Chitinophaga sp. G-6-1-13]|uniref:Novel STAND NTPase 3 domain-containing protein n=1 Tax=Chitinophaga fulva TaxID=2728842 RepID=A0A848GJA9_9BACT|nr:hypothetical protein [Chitinophaga fulva]NML38685.1 hypothetical protein [Chitinophaga fulva]
MPATVDGQKGYDYQYIVTTFFALQLIDNVSSGWTEAVGREDAFFQLQVSDTLIPVELQVKRRKARLDLHDLAEMLCHFEEQSTTSCLITRMINDPQLRAYFVINTTVTDDVGKLSILSDKDSFEHIQFKPTQTILRQLASKLGSVQDKRKVLAPARNQTCQQLSALFSADIDQLKNLMARCFIIEGMTEPDLLHRVDLLLANQHKIASSSRPIIADQLIKLINRSKGGADSFIPAFKNILRRPQIHLPFLPSSYIPRPDETRLKQLLQSDSYLLLTGPSLCGKSDTAKSICWSLLLSSEMTSGYSHSIDAAESFLLSSGNEERLYLLDDPFGHLPETPVTNQLLKLQKLIKNLPQHTRRYLIVTSNERVLRTASGPMLSWNDLTVTDRSFLQQIWMKMVDGSGKINSVLSETVTNLLKQEPTGTLLQPGHLDHLARNAAEVRLSDPIAVRTYAYIDAERIMLEIPSKLKKDFAMLSCLADTITGCSVEEIAFVSDDTAEEQPGLLPEYGNIPPEIKWKNDTAPFPSFKLTYKLSPTLQNTLDNFEDRGYITREDEHYRFRHPIYLQAARQCLVPCPDPGHQEIRRMLIRCLSTVNYNVATHAINAISWVLQQAASQRQSSYLRHLLEVAETGLRSIFPSIQDQSFYILLSYYDQLNTELRKTIRKRIEDPGNNTHAMKWHGGIPYFPVRKGSLIWRMKDWKTIPETDANRIRQKLAKGVSVSPQQAWQYLDYMENKARHTKSRVTADIASLQKALLFNESFIKESAAYLLAASASDSNIALLEMLFFEDSPEVLFHVVKGAWRAYPYFSLPANKTKVSQWIIEAFSKKWIPLRSLDFITQFDIGYSHNSFDWENEIEEEVCSDMWDVWAKVMPVILPQLPINVRYHSPRFAVTLKTAIEKLPPLDNLKITQSWLRWIKRFPDQYEGREEVFEDLMIFFCSFMLQLSFNERLTIIDSLTSSKVPFFRGVAFRYLLPQWENLTPAEQDLLCHKVKTEIKAIQAIALTGYSNPNIQIAICGHPLDKENIAEILSIISESFLLHCLTIIYIESNYYHLDYTDYRFWNNVLHHYINDTKTPAHQLAIYQLAKTFVLEGDNRPRLKWPNILQTIIEIYTNSPDEIKNWTAAAILYFSEWSSSHHAVVKLSDFFTALNPANKDSFVANIMNYIQLFSEIEILSNMSEELNEAMAKYLQEDIYVLTELPKKKTDIIQTADTCLTYFEKGVIRTQYAFERFQTWLEKHRHSFPATYFERFLTTQATFSSTRKSLREQLFNEIHQPFESYMLP